MSKGERYLQDISFEKKKKRRSSQDIRGGDEGATSQVYGIFEHEEVVEVAHQVPCQLVNKTAGVKETQYLELLKHNIDKVWLIINSKEIIHLKQHGMHLCSLACGAICKWLCRVDYF